MKDSSLRKQVQSMLYRSHTLYQIDEGLSANLLEVTLDGKCYAIKVFKDVQSLEERQQELIANTTIKSQFVVQYVCHDETNLEWILYEKFGDYNLQKYLEIAPLNQYEAYHIFTQILKGCKDIHDCGYFHGDLKTANILIDMSLTIKICDLGFAIDTKSPQHRRRGSFGYMAPEYLTPQGTVNEKTEVFALGVILHQLLTGHLPYKNQYSCQKWQQLVNNKWTEFWKGSKIPKKYKELLQLMLSSTPESRCSLNFLQNI